MENKQQKAESGRFTPVCKPDEAPTPSGTTKKVLYKQVRNCAPINIYHLLPCKEEFVRYVDAFGWTTSPSIDAIQSTEGKGRWCEWLEKNGFIEKIQEEETVPEGTRFTIGGEEKLLVYCGKAGLVDMETGHYWYNFVEIVDCLKITKNEFAQMVRMRDVENVWFTRRLPK